jgi:hypothetical protein
MNAHLASSTGAPINDEDRGAKSGITNINSPIPRRRRTERTARRIIEEAPYPGRRRPEAYRRIRNAKQPVKEANRIISHYMTNRHELELVDGPENDLSDVQELRAKLIRRDYGIWSPHTDYLHRMEKDILSGNMDLVEFRRRSSVVLEMEQPLRVCPKSLCV